MFKGWFCITRNGLLSLYCLIIQNVVSTCCTVPINELCCWICVTISQFISTAFLKCLPTGLNIRNVIRLCEARCFLVYNSIILVQNYPELVAHTESWIGLYCTFFCWRCYLCMRVSKIFFFYLLNTKTNSLPNYLII